MKDPETPVNITDQAPRLAILQRVCPGYRIALFSRLSADTDWHCKLFIGENIPNSKVNSAAQLPGVRFEKLRTRFYKIGHRVFPWHAGLIRALKEFEPDVILCEGESHFLGYLQAIWFKLFVNRKVALIHWCFISLPGEPVVTPGFAGRIKTFVRRFFDAHLLYSSFSRDRLKQIGVQEEKMFVATNVGDVKKFLATADALPIDTAVARQKLNLPDRFTVLYTGTLDPNKRPEILLDLAAKCDKLKFNFVLLGSGEMLEGLRARVEKENLVNVFLPGRVTDNLSLYFRGADVLIIPGRGGIVISEAMAFELPVVTHQADGTEYDLIRNNQTGFILKNGGVEDFQRALEFLQQNSAQCREMGKAGRRLVTENFTTENMTNQIKRAAVFAKKAREKKTA